MADPNLNPITFAPSFIETSAVTQPADKPWAWGVELNQPTYGESPIKKLVKVQLMKEHFLNAMKANAVSSMQAEEDLQIFHGLQIAQMPPTIANDLKKAFGETQNTNIQPIAETITIISNFRWDFLC